MKVAIIGANGKQGGLLVKEAKSRGLNVKGIVLEGQSEADETLVKDVLNLQYEDIKDCDVIIDALGFWTPETLHLHPTTLKYLTDLLANQSNRLLVVGGAGSLYVNPEHTMMVQDTPDFPDMFKPLAKEMGDALNNLRKVDNVNWTYLSPAGDFQFEGERTGKYKLAGEELTLNSKGESTISYADYSICMIDLAVSGGHNKERVSVVSE